MAAVLDEFDHEAWKTTFGMLVAYLGILVAITIVLFAVPYLVFLGL